MLIGGKRMLIETKFASSGFMTPFWAPVAEQTGTAALSQGSGIVSPWFKKGGFSHFFPEEKSSV